MIIITIINLLSSVLSGYISYFSDTLIYTIPAKLTFVLVTCCVNVINPLK